jgi:23S rRNA pseudouridine1911/1915/1917 synthase
LRDEQATTNAGRIVNALAPFAVPEAETNATLAAVLRVRLPGLSWSQVRAVISARRVKVLNELCLDPARRVKAGDTIELLARAEARKPESEQIQIRFIDNHIVVVEKPSGLSTVRHPSEREWSKERKRLSPTLEDLVAEQIARKSPSRLRIVHRLDKETSGLLVFARSVEAERALGQQFRQHTVVRRYHAIVPGHPKSQRIHNYLTRDRGDGRRGSTTLASAGKEAITHLETLERWPGYALVQCRLETGRTHQIRIHLAELGHPICGEKVYTHKRDGTVYVDRSNAPRLMLHAIELGFTHPITEEVLHWEMPMPVEWEAFLCSMTR